MTGDTERATGPRKGKRQCNSFDSLHHPIFFLRVSWPTEQRAPGFTCYSQTTYQLGKTR